MARSNVKINISFLASVISIVFIFLMTIGSLTVVFFWSINKFILLNTYEIKVLVFTLKQALFSSFLACLLAIPIARALIGTSLAPLCFTIWRTKTTKRRARLMRTSHRQTVQSGPLRYLHCRGIKKDNFPTNGTSKV